MLHLSNQQGVNVEASMMPCFVISKIDFKLGVVQVLHLTFSATATAYLTGHDRSLTSKMSSHNRSGPVTY